MNIFYNFKITLQKGKGRPSVEIQENQLLQFYREGCTATEMARHFGCSNKTIYKQLYQKGMPLRARYCQITDDELESKIRQIHGDHPNAGHTVLLSYLHL